MIDDKDNGLREKYGWIPFAPTCRTCFFLDRNVDVALPQCRFDTPFGTATLSVCTNYKAMEVLPAS